MKYKKLKVWTGAAFVLERVLSKSG